MGWERARQGQETQDELGLAASGRIPVAGVGDIDAGYCLRFLRHIRDCSFATVDAEQKALVDRMFELNPSMDRLYPAESRYACEVFCIEDGSGEYFDLGQKPIVRVPFAIGRASLDAKGALEVSEGCEGCGACAAVCPQGCIAHAEDGTFRIDRGACLRCGLCEEACPRSAIRRIGG